MGTNTGIGIGIGIPFKNNALGGDKPYFPPELEARMIGVWDNYGKKNTDADRNIIKNKIPNAGGDLEILNSAYKLNSGFGKYEVDFTSWIQTDGVIASSNKVQNSVVGRFLYFNTVNKKEDVPSFKVNITLGQQSKLQYNYIKEDGTGTYIVYSESGIYTIPASYFSKYTGGNSWFGFYQIEGTSIIEQIPSFEGALVTDGINDIVASIKTLEEWNIGDKGITIVSMIHQINTNTNNFITTNNLRNENRVIGRNTVTNIGKTGIYGWYKKDIQGTTATLIDNILGDKNDYTGHYTESTNSVANSKFYVTGYAVENGFTELSSVAHYWTFAVLGKATEDEINLIIAKYNLDRTLRPDILCNIERQDITNDNHADFNDKLIDYSGNGRDIQMYNLAWKGGSGVAAKKFETIKDYLIVPDEGLQELTIYNEFSYKVKSIKHADRYWTVQSLNKTDVSYPITIIADKDIIWRNILNYTDENGVKGNIRKETNVPANTPTQVFVLGFNDFDVPDNYTKVNCVAYATRTDITEFTITFIPSYKGGILLDGIEDFGKVIEMTIYKDYTVIADYIRTSAKENAQDSPILSKSQVVNNGAFVFNYLNTNSVLNSYSFGINNGLENISDSERKIYYQSKYVNDGKSINSGTAIDYNSMWLGTYRDNVQIFFNGTIYSLMSFPYSMSEFLIERQLKKHKLGTLYPNMVEFRPVIKANANYNIFYTALLPLTGIVWEKINIGDYIPVGRRVAIQLSFDNEASELVSAISSQLGNISITKNSNNKGYTIFGDILKNKSPQKINITIDEYIRYEDIVQPYPVLLRFNDENGNEVSWGGKFRVGSTITRIGSDADSNLLPNIYNIFGLLLNDNQVTSSKVIVEKTMVFKAKSAYIFDNNEPKVILSPSRLRIPNSSYKILGYIPDISGHGNHGVIHNSAYAGASGANGYPYDYNNSSFWCDSNLAKVVSGELVEYFAVKNSTGFSNITSGVYKGEIKVTGVTKAISENKISRLRIFTNSTTDKEIIDITQDGNYNIDIKGVGDANRVFFYAIPNNSNESIIVRLTEPIRIEQVGEHEGAYCFDGVNDHVTIPTVTGGGKQVLMKVNNNTINSMLYDQRSSGASPNSLYNDFAIYCTNSADNNQIAYQSRLVGNTYIDGILNTNITCEDLLGVLHNITITCDIVAPNNGVVPNIGRGGVLKDLYSKVALYDFMLFDNISTDDKIKQLNEYVGIEAKVELPPYYWDAYGKTNLDGDKATIQQRGIVKGYNFAPFDNELDWYLSSNTYIDVVSRNGYTITLKNLSTGIDGWRFQNTTTRGFLSKDIPFKLKTNKQIKVYWDMHYNKVSEEGLFQEVISNPTINPNEDTLINLKHLTEEKLTELNANKSTIAYLLWFDLSTLAVDEEVTIEMLPVEGGKSLALSNTNFVYDKMSGYGGYSLGRFDKSWASSSSNNTSVIVVSRNPYDITLKKLGGNSDWEFNNTELKVISNPVSVKFKSNKNIRVTCDYHYYPVGGNSEGTPLGITSKDLIANKDAIITISPISQENIDKYNIDVNRGYYLIYFQLSSTLAVNEEVIIEMLPLYPNGLVYDGISDYSENVSIPIFDDFTFLVKASLPNGFTGSGGTIAKKGSNNQVTGGGYDFVYALDSSTTEANRNSYWSFGKALLPSTGAIDPPLIGYMTKTDVNGIPTTAGTNPSIEGITFSRWSGYISMIFYKAILYPKTIPLLQINFLKNLMERDEIIDLDNPIFKK